MMTIIAALAPVTLRRYDLTEHQVLALSSVLVLVSYSGLAFIHIRAPEYKEAAAVLAMYTRKWVEVAEAAAYVLIVGGPVLALIVIALGVAPGLEAPLYFTVVVIFLVQAAWTLLWLVFTQRRPASA